MKRLEISLSTNSNETLLEEYYKYKNELESIYNFIAEGIILRSKASWYQHGEKSSKYFLNLEKRNEARSHLRKMINSDGHEVCDETEIRQKLKQFYSSSYKRLACEHALCSCQSSFSFIFNFSYIHDRLIKDVVTKL